MERKRNTDGERERRKGYITKDKYFHEHHWERVIFIPVISKYNRTIRYAEDKVLK